MLSVTVDTQAVIAQLNAATTRAVRAPAIMATMHKRSMGRLTQRYLTVLKAEPPLAKAGVTKLMTPRQRRAFFATQGFGGGIPHIRTHALSQGWQAQVTALNSGGEVSLFNEVPGINYVEGYDQQPFLAAVGWLYAPPILERFSNEADAITRANWTTASDLYAGVPQT